MYYYFTSGVNTYQINTEAPKESRVVLNPDDTQKNEVPRLKESFGFSCKYQGQDMYYNSETCEAFRITLDARPKVEISYGTNSWVELKCRSEEELNGNPPPDVRLERFHDEMIAAAWNHAHWYYGLRKELQEQMKNRPDQEEAAEAKFYTGYYEIKQDLEDTLRAAERMLLDALLLPV
jgi:hypothetical protein